jgi:hypothetical protein
MLFLFSDVVNMMHRRTSVSDHVDIARQLAPAGEPGLTLTERFSNALLGFATFGQHLGIPRHLHKCSSGSKKYPV